MILEENKQRIADLEQELLNNDLSSEEVNELKAQLKELKVENYSNLTSWYRVTIARSEQRLRSK